MLTVALDAAPLVGDRTGIGVAVAGTLAALAEGTDLDLVGYGLTGSRWPEVRSQLPPGARPARGPMPAAALLRVWRLAGFPPIEMWTGPVDVVHGTNFVVPPARHAGRLVTVHDLTAVRYPELCTPTSLLYPDLVKRAIDQGAWVHTITRFIADEVVDHFGIEPDRVAVVPHGIDVRGCSDTGSPSDLPPYVLALGTVEPRKDIPGLVKAFDIVAENHPDLELWIAGPEGWGEAELTRTVEAARHKDRVRRLGWQDDVRSLLRGATVLAYPSLYEGFGLPPLEAMSVGVPVVATSAGSVAEVAGNAAVLSPPGDPEAFAEAICSVLEDEELRASLIRRGYERAGEFTWEGTARALRDVYRAIAESRK